MRFRQSFTRPYKRGVNMSEKFKTQISYVSAFINLDIKYMSEYIHAYSSRKISLPKQTYTR